MRFNPFNPQQPAKPTFFVGRTEEVKTFTNFLGQTINNSPMNISITGDRGMGKTSILNKFEEIAIDNNCLVVKISNYEGNVKNVVEFSDFLISNIQTELLSKDVISKNVENLRKFVNSLKPEISYQNFSLSIEKKQVIQEFLRERLSSIWENVKENYKAIVILIDEAESLEKIDALIFLREVFQRVEAHSNYMIVLAGKLNFPEKMSESFSPLNRFFPALRLKKLKKEDVDIYLQNRLKQANTQIDYSAINSIYNKSEGHPYVLVCFGFLIFDSLNESEAKINKEIVGRCMEKIRRRLSEDYFTPMFYPIRPRAKSILCKIANNIDGLDFTFAQALKITGLKKGSQLSPYMLEFRNQGIIIQYQRGAYKLFHNLFKEYLIANSGKYIN